MPKMQISENELDRALAIQMGFREKQQLNGPPSTYSVSEEDLVALQKKYGSSYQMSALKLQSFDPNNH